MLAMGWAGRASRGKRRWPLQRPGRAELRVASAAGPCKGLPSVRAISVQGVVRPEPDIKRLALALLNKARAEAKAEQEAEAAGSLDQAETEPRPPRPRS
jgi:hypothetical protein